MEEDKVGGKILTNKKGNPPYADSLFMAQPVLFMIWGCPFFHPSPTFAGQFAYPVRSQSLFAA
jgi:hypothetical protein